MSSKMSNHEKKLPKLAVSEMSLAPRRALKPLDGQLDLFDLGAKTRKSTKSKRP